MSEQAQGPGWWKASDGKWYPPETHPSTQTEHPEGWWLASDGNWYPPESRPEPQADPTVALRPDPEPTERLVVEEEVEEPARRPGRAAPAVGGLAAAWHGRRGLRVATYVAAGLVAIGVIGSLAGDNDEPGQRVPSGLVDTTVATVEDTTTTEPPTTTVPATTTSAPAATVPALTAPTTTTSPTTTPAATTATTTRTVQQGVTPGAFCSPAGAVGATVTGVPMECRIEAGDTRARWRAA